MNSESSNSNIPPVVTNADTGARLDQNKAWAGLFMTKIAVVKSKRQNPGKKKKDSQTSALRGLSYASASDKRARMETSASNKEVLSQKSKGTTESLLCAKTNLRETTLVGRTHTWRIRCLQVGSFRLNSDPNTRRNSIKFEQFF